ncbi:MAG: NADPH-dependent 7-cyano-7-deazaguanine reductase QueF, partial [Thermoplasmata archaeon]
HITYVPDKYIVELRSLKLYLNTYRDKYITHEEAVNRIYADLKQALAPRSIEIVGDFNVRGGIKTVVRVSSSGAQ